MRFITLMGILFIFGQAQASLSPSEILQKSSGRIIRVIETKDVITVDNICSATLIRLDTIVTASHCFYRNPDEISKYPEKLYFDIDGITSEGLSQKIDPLKNEKGEISLSNKNQVLSALKNMALITQTKIHKKYIQSAVAAYGSEVAPEAENDVAVGKLDRKLKTSFVKIAEYQDGETIYLAGHPGKHLAGKQKVVTCESGKPTYDYLVSKVDSTVERVSGKRKGKATPANNRAVKLANYKKFYETAILNLCEDTIVRGYSGGPQVVVRNNEVYIVGVTSQMFESMYGLAGDKVLGAKVLNLWNIPKNN